MPVFINREKETRFLTDWLHAEPNALLFVYGPKSCGKSTLLLKVVEEQVDYKKFAVNYLDLRGMLIINFKSFINRFFPKSIRGQAKDVLGGLTMNVGFFGLNIDEETALQEDPFRVMESKLAKAVKKGIRPVIILDEIQMLKNIYINGERFLLDELFNLFVRLTKVTHLSHIVLLTSDSYFIEKIYNNAKLKKTSELFYVGHLAKEDVWEWLHKEGYPENDILFIWENLGGSAWEINQVLQKVKQQVPLKQAVRHFLEDEYGKLVDFLRTSTTEQEEAVIRKVHKDIVENNFAHTGDFDKALNPIIPKMVAHDFWFFRSDTQQITANSESIRQAMKRLVGNT